MATVELKNHQILNSTQALQALQQRDELPIKLAYATMKNLKKIEVEAQDLETFRVDLLKSLAETDENGNIQSEVDEDGNETGKVKFIDEDAKKEFADKLNELYNDTTSLELHKVDVSRLNDDFHIEPRLIIVLEWMLDGEIN